MNDKLTYKELEPRILDALRARGEHFNGSGINEPLTLVAVTTIQIQNSLTEFNIGGPGIPAAILIGENTGRIYQFALKALLPDLSI